MEKKYAFLLAGLITLIIAGNYLFFNAAEIFPEREKAVVSRVLDGDTLELEDGRTIRLLNINAPEKGRAGSEEATNFLKQFENETIELDKEGIGIYGRILGRIYSGSYINLKMVRLGLAHASHLEDEEVREFKEVEKEARESEIGLWEKSDQYGCLTAEINKKEEYVAIESQCESNFEGWTLKDESTRNYKFEKIEEKDFIIYSDSGTDKEGEYYWGRGKAWNDDSDSIFIRDENGFLVYYGSYGY
jgi:endonuclease YncB( thermonuclease family)